ncbi:MAG: ABC transporter ATP-binding protein [Gammaproteobacteria bacterium]
MIVFDNIGVIFNRGTALETAALRGINLTVAAGDFITVIGSNGAGKSTLLSVLAGEAEAAKGGIRIDGKSTSKMAAHKLAAKVARVFQNPTSGTCAELTIEENLALAAARGKSRGWKLALTTKNREHFRARLAKLELGLENRLREPVGSLSGGQRQALSLVMATLAPSRILLLDEHTAALDPKMAEFVLTQTRRAAKDYDLTMLMVTHSMKAALSCGNRTLMLHQGKIVLDIAGEERARTTPETLLHQFTKSAADHEDRLMLS